METKRILSTRIASPKGHPYYRSFRLPSLVLTPQGTLLCAFEARTATGDLNEMDLCLTRSTDGGKTWQPYVVLAHAADFRAHYGSRERESTLNNPVLIVGKDGAVHLLFSFDNGLSGLFHTVSRDAGIRWDEPINILPQLTLPEGRVRISCGPSHGVCTSNGRLITPAWLSQYDFRDYPVYTLYSDDNGTTWHLGERVADNFDETACALLSDGSLLLNSRQFSVAYNDARPMSKPQNEEDARRRLSVSTSGIGNWSPTYAHPVLVDPGCEGSMTSTVTAEGQHVLLFVNDADTQSRTHLTVRASLDDGTTWPYALLLDKERAVYSDVALAPNGTAWVVHEDAPDEPLCHDLEMLQFSLEQLISQSMRLDGEQPV